nr:NTP transferase domain-containing protein [Pyrinomonadaceae bacterium]
GLSQLGVEAVCRAGLEQFNALGQEAERYRNRIGMLLDSITTTIPALDVWPVIVAAGRGTRARATGLNVPKPLAEVAGLPAVRRVLSVVQRGTSLTRPPIIIVSPQTESGVREALEGEDVIFVLQPQAYGTGDAVLCAEEQMRGFTGLALIMWSTQPVIRVETVRRTLKLAALFDDYKMFVPTALKPNPYAPISRNQNGQVLAARETHLENADSFSFGETNIGLFVLKSEAMFERLRQLRRRYWNEAEQRYTRAKGELGFPNELIGILSEQEIGVLASPIADAREEQGIKGLEDIARCEQFILELQTNDERGTMNAE